MLDLKDSEFARAQGVWQKKFGAPAADANERAKHYRFLLTRGFSAEVVRKVVQQSGAPEENFDS
jgi:regulatory protein